MKLLDFNKIYPPKILIYSEPGRGKSSLALTFPEPLFLLYKPSFPNGNINYNAIQINSFEEFHETLDKLIDMLNKGRENGEFLACQTLVIDHLSDFEDLVNAKIASDNGVKTVSEIPYGGGHEKKRLYWGSSDPIIKVKNKLYRGLIPRLERISETFGLCLLYLAHGSVRPLRKQLGDTYDVFQPDWSEQLKSVIAKNLNEAIAIVPSVVSTGKNDKISAGYLFKCGSNHADYYTKTRCDMTSELPYMKGKGYEVLSKYISKWW